VPLPDQDIPWPPEQCHHPARKYETWRAWYSGDLDQLANVYGANGPIGLGLDPKGYDQPDQQRGGFLQRLHRWFWGSPASRGELRSAKLHLPLASDIAVTSADLLFSEPPKPAADDDTTSQRLDDLLGDGGLYAILMEAGETCAAYGGVYLRPCWDTEISDLPITEVVTPDQAAPEFRYGHLVAVTFWEIVARDQGKVWRHLERREPGVILHGLYEGTSDRLGRPVPLQDQEATAHLAGLVDENGAVPTGGKLLPVAYVPNMRPNRVLPKHPALGRSDYQGVEPFLDALDETWTSWMRDLRLGKGRIIVPAAYLQSQGRGRGALFDPEQEVYSTLDMLPKPDGSGSMITPNQFAIRVEEHQRTAAEQVTVIVRGAGYSMQTFGEQGEVAATATEVHARERRSYTTRGRKINYWRPALARLLEVTLEIDQAVFRSRVTPQRPRIEWPDGIQPDPEALARTLQLLQAAQAASTDTKVRLYHPDWDDQQVAAEVARITAEQSVSVPDPTQFGSGGNGQVPGEELAGVGAG
jgi:A118 family predicted phage portal protein